MNANDRAVADSSGKFMLAIKYTTIGQKIPSKNDVRSYFDIVQEKVTESSFVELVGIFERITFKKLDNACGSIRSVVTSSYKSPQPFALSGEKLVRGASDVNNLKEIKNILDGKIPKDLHSKLGEIIEYRNRLAHGKRFGYEVKFVISDAAFVLNEVLENI